MAIRVGRWDCNRCGHSGNLGPSTHCSQCGATRPKEVVFYLPEDAEIVTDEDRIQEAHQGADWVCGYCVSNNKASNLHCTTCGNPNGGKEKTLEQREYALGEVPTGEKEKSAYQDDYEELMEKKPGLARLLKKLGLPGGILVAVFGFLASFSSTIDVTVEAMPWERTIFTEHYIEVEEEDWQVPTAGRMLDAFQAVHHYNKVSKGFETVTRDKKVQVGTRKVVCGQRDKGNGYFEDVYCDEPVYETQTETYQEEIFEKVPVYKTKYRFAIFRWKDAEPLKTSGNKSPAKWADDPRLANTDKFREKRREGDYFLKIKDHKGEIHQEEVSLKYWEGIRQGQTLKAEKSTIFGYYKGLIDDVGVY